MDVFQSWLATDVYQTKHPHQEELTLKTWFDGFCFSLHIYLGLGQAAILGQYVSLEDPNSSFKQAIPSLDLGVGV